MRILSNVTFLFVSLSYTAESAIVTAFITFIPKFIESQFGIPASSASIYTGELAEQRFSCPTKKKNLQNPSLALKHRAEWLQLCRQVICCLVSVPSLMVKSVEQTIITIKTPRL